MSYTINRAHASYMSTSWANDISVENWAPGGRAPTSDTAAEPVGTAEPFHVAEPGVHAEGTQGVDAGPPDRVELRAADVAGSTTHHWIHGCSSTVRGDGM